MKRGGPSLPRLGLVIQTPDVDIAIPVALLSGTLEEKLAKAKNWGADGVELMTVEPRAVDTAALKRVLDQAGLEVAAIASGALAFAADLTLLHTDVDKARLATARLHDMISFAAALHAPLVTVGSFRGRLAWMGRGSEQHLIAVLREAADHAESLGVRLVVEPLNRYETDFIHTADEGLRFLDEVGHPAVGLLLDTYHMNIEESEWRAPLARTASAGRLWHVHIGDNHRLAPGRGMINFGAIVSILRDVGYRGYLCAELLAQPDPDSAAQETLRHMRPLVY